jgi:hypothetical protein
MPQYPLDPAAIIPELAAIPVGTTAKNGVKSLDFPFPLRYNTFRTQSSSDCVSVFGALAQLVARIVRIDEVSGSNPLCSTTIKAGKSPVFFYSCYPPFIRVSLFWQLCAIVALFAPFPCQRLPSGGPTQKPRTFQGTRNPPFLGLY